MTADIDPTWVAAVVGSPVARSLSPEIHEAAFRASGRSGSFGRFDCGPGDFDVFLEALRASSMVGVSVTMPLKELAWRSCDSLAPSCGETGAVNCIVSRNGSLTGHNTDGDGCVAALVEQGGAAIAGSRAVVLGAGGTARSVAVALARAGATVTIVNRTPARAHDVAGMVLRATGGTCEVGDVTDVDGADIVVNTTSVGMGSHETPLEGSHLRRGLVVLDAVYHPLETRLLAEARAAGARVVDGLWMLVHQARIQQEIWFGSLPDAMPMRHCAEGRLAGRE